MDNNISKTIVAMDDFFTTENTKTPATEEMRTINGYMTNGNTLGGGMVTAGFFTGGNTIVGMTSTKNYAQQGLYQPMSAEGDKTRRTSTDFNSPFPTDEPGEFNLKGIIYKNIRCISKSSGEAQVFLVENEGKEYVLKIMYPNFKVNAQLIKIVANFNFEMITAIYDYGKTYVAGVSRNYELMEYLQGGTLEKTKINDLNQFRRIALQAAAALEFCHYNNIIHKDIKPGNFFFRDKERTQLVLGDFGISSLLKDNEYSHRTTQARTPIFAAPEMYADVIDGETEITPAVDYYSLGITLMTIWLGESPFSGNERQAIKTKSEGKLPRIDELPERVKMIVQGMTTVNPMTRWTYDEVERWFKGESPKIDISSPFLRYKDFVVDPERNIVAHNVKELIPMLMENEQLACTYLYGGRIGDWLTQCGNTKLSATVNDIVTNRYPIEHTAGLMAAVYMMDKAYPYTDINGKQCTDIHDIAMSMLDNPRHYANALCNPNDTMWVYIETHSKSNVNRMRSYFINGNPEACNKAIVRTAYEIDPDIPFMAKYPSSTVKEIVHAFGYEDITDDDWLSVTDGRLLSWMYSHESHIACESLRILTENKDHDRELAYSVLYNIDREAAYDLRAAYTPQQVGELLAAKLAAWQSTDEKDFAEKMKEFTSPTGRFASYAQLHGWTQIMVEAQSCFNLDSEDNRNRLGAYDLRTAAYRFCRILEKTPYYILPNGGKLTDGRNIDQRFRNEIRNEMRNGSFTQWLAVFFHEDPTQDFSEAYSYERMLEYWLLALGDLDAQQQYFKRYETAKNETAKKYDDVRSIYRKIKSKEATMKSIYYTLCGIWAFLVIICGISNKEYFINHQFATVALPVGGMTAIIVAARAYFRGFGFIISCFWAILGALSSAIPIWLMTYTYSHFPSMLTPVILVITAGYMALCYYTDFRSENRINTQLINEVLDQDIKSQMLEPLYYTFKTRAFKFKGSNFGVLDDVQTQIRSNAGESLVHYVLWSIMVSLLVAEMVLFSPNLLNIKNPNLDFLKPQPSKVEKQLEQYNKNIKEIK